MYFVMCAWLLSVMFVITKVIRSPGKALFWKT